MLTTAISIHVKVAAHFAELSVPLMVHHDLVFPERLSSSLSKLSLVPLTVMALTNEREECGWQLSHGLCTQTKLKER